MDSAGRLIANKNSVFHHQGWKEGYFRFKISFRACCLITIFALYNISCKFSVGDCRRFSPLNCMLILMCSTSVGAGGKGGEGGLNKLKNVISIYIFHKTDCVVSLFQKNVKC